jgi:hypothetical protein
MADVTISDLGTGTPVGGDVVPYSTGTRTNKVTISSLPVAWSSITGKPAVTVSTQAGPPSNTVGNNGDIYYQVS